MTFKGNMKTLVKFCGTAKPVTKKKKKKSQKLLLVWVFQDFHSEVRDVPCTHTYSIERNLSPGKNNSLKNCVYWKSAGTSNSALSESLWSSWTVQWFSNRSLKPQGSPPKIPPPPKHSVFSYTKAPHLEIPRINSFPFCAGR